MSTNTMDDEDFYDFFRKWLLMVKQPLENKVIWIKNRHTLKHVTFPVFGEIRALLRDFIQATWMLDISVFCLKGSTGLNLFSYPWSLYPIPGKQCQMYNIENTGKWDRKRGSVALNRLELAVHTQDKNIWFVTRNKRKMWFGDSWVSFPPWLHGWWTSWQILPKFRSGL